MKRDRETEREEKKNTCNELGSARLTDRPAHAPACYSEEHTHTPIVGAHLSANRGMSSPGSFFLLLPPREPLDFLVGSIASIEKERSKFRLSSHCPETDGSFAPKYTKIRNYRSITPSSAHTKHRVLDEGNRIYFRGKKRNQFRKGRCTPRENVKVKYKKNHDVKNLAVITKRKSTETIRPADRFPGDFRRDKTKSITNHFPPFPKLYINALSKCKPVSPDH